MQERTQVRSEKENRQLSTNVRLYVRRFVVVLCDFHCPLTFVEERVNSISENREQPLGECQCLAQLDLEMYNIKSPCYKIYCSYILSHEWISLVEFLQHDYSWMLHHSETHTRCSVVS